MTGGDYQDNSIVENSQNTEKSPGDLRRLANTDVNNSLGVNNNRYTKKTLPHFFCCLRITKSPNGI